MSLGSPGDTEEARYTAVMERLQYDSLEFASESRHRTDSYSPYIFAFTISQLNVYINLEFLKDYIILIIGFASIAFITTFST